MRPRWTMPTSPPTHAAGSDPVAALTQGERLHAIGPLHYHAVVRPKYLLVRYEGQVETVAIAEQWFEHLDGLLREHALSRILWDSRPALGHPPEVRARIWAWLEAAEVLKRSSIVVQSDMLRLSANLTGLGGTLALKAFADFEDAERWLVR